VESEVKNAGDRGRIGAEMEEEEEEDGRVPGQSGIVDRPQSIYHRRIETLQYNNQKGKRRKPRRELGYRRSRALHQRVERGNRKAALPHPFCEK